MHLTGSFLEEVLVMNTRKLCQNCFFYNFTSKDCATEHKIPLKKEKCRFFEKRVVVTVYYENQLDNRNEATVPFYFKSE